MLKKYGKKNLATKLHKKVVAYHMGGNIEIRDPATKQKVKKPSKPFMVNNAVLQLEQDRIVLPMSEDTQVLVDSTENQSSGTGQGLVQQMRNFSIERVSSTGLPTYSQGEEHTLTAWMLSIVAFTLELSDVRGRLAFNPPRITKSLNMPREDTPQITKQGQMLADAARNVGIAEEPKKSSEGGQIYRANERTSIAHGNKNTISKYYGKSNVDRTSKLDGRGSVWRRGRGRSGF